MVLTAFGGCRPAKTLMCGAVPEPGHVRPCTTGNGGNGGIGGQGQGACMSEMSISRGLPRDVFL